MAKKFCPFPDVGEVLLLLLDTFRGMPQKSSNSQKPGPEVALRQRVAKERAVHEFVAGQCRMRCPVTVSAGAAKRILDYANSREIRV